MFLPNNTQYTRLVQKVSNSLKKTKFSPISPQNKHSSAVQAFGASGALPAFKPKRDMTLGYFATPSPFD